MTGIFAITVPIFLIVSLGFAAARWNLLGTGAGTVLNRYVLTFALPATIFFVVSQVPIDQLNQPGFMLAYGIGGVMAWLLIFSIVRFGMRKPVRQALLSGMGGAMPNNIFFGFPILVQLFGSPPGNAFAMALVLENMLIFAPLLLLLQVSQDQTRSSWWAVAGSVVANIFRSPIMMAIIAGVAWSASGWQLPVMLYDGLELIADSAAAVALFAIGFSIATSRFSFRTDWVSVAMVVTSKLVAHPVLVLCLVLLLPDFDPRLQVAAVLVAAVPMASIFPLIGARYGHERVCLSILMVTVLVSFFSVSAWIGVLTWLFL